MKQKILMCYFQIKVCVTLSVFVRLKKFKNLQNQHDQHFLHMPENRTQPLPTHPNRTFCTVRKMQKYLDAPLFFAQFPTFSALDG